MYNKYPLGYCGFIPVMLSLPKHFRKAKQVVLQSLGQKSIHLVFFREKTL